MRGALLRNPGDDTLEVVDGLEIGDPGPGEVKIKITNTGVCHSDLSVMNGTIPQPPPVILGHEGAGTITAVGEGVPGLAEGDHVIVAWSPPCGDCADCVDRKSPHLCQGFLMNMAVPKYKLGDTDVFGMAGAGTWAEETLMPWQGAIKIPDDVPLDVASLIGCAVMTGVGAAINTAKVVPGSSVVVFGCGGVGISVIQGARVAGAAEIVAVDLVDDKLETAKKFGATHAVKPDDLAGLQGELTGGAGFDYAFEAIGNPITMRAAYDAIRRGGMAVIVGVGRADQTFELSAFEMFYGEKHLVGSYYGSTDVRSDFHRIIRLWRAGKIDLEAMITREIEIDDINDALGAMERGEVVRQVISF
jgi:S-(hydroxymethyl)glutathione dehydrogenase / alcohol dehydrogenase